MLSEDELKDAVLLVLANKQDMGVMSVSEVVENSASTLLEEETGIFKEPAL